MRAICAKNPSLDINITRVNRMLNFLSGMTNIALKREDKITKTIEDFKKIESKGFDIIDNIMGKQRISEKDINNLNFFIFTTFMNPHLTGKCCSIIFKSMLNYLSFILLEDIANDRE